MSVPYFDIQERQESGWLRLRLIGELDLGAIRGVEERLRQLGAANQSVRLDLSGLTFIDSSGIRLLLHTLRGSQRDGWDLEVDPQVSGPVRRIFRLANVEGLIVRDDREEV